MDQPLRPVSLRRHRLAPLWDRIRQGALLFHGPPPNSLRRILRLAALIGMVAVCGAVQLPTGPAWGFDNSGHHYTHVAILNGGYTTVVDHSLLVQSFCAVLPDLAYELDAVVQRARVFNDSDERGGWAWFGNCATKVCAHMVATQFYLHALTGTSTEGIRKAAVAMIHDLEQKINKLESESAPKQEVVNALCARGFAIHLFGDTFAHARLDKGAELYELGTGHGKVLPDNHAPDYVFSREQQHWVAWVKDLGGNLGVAEALTVKLQQLAPVQANRTNREGECWMQSELARYAGTAWTPWVPKIEDWTDSICPSKGPPKQGKISAFTSAVKSALAPKLKTCQEVINDGPDPTPGVTVISLKGELATLKSKLPPPICETVWKTYLALAYEQFNDQPGVRGMFGFGSEKKLNPEALGYGGTDPRQDGLSDGGHRGE